ncbi:MAG: hypothetical protein Q9208_003346 [Pyrenodesmia sp. 3 TL-2023]
MRRSNLLGAVACVTCLPFLTPASPFAAPPNAQIWSPQPNTTSALTTPIPPEFKVEITIDTAVPLAPEEIYRTAIHMMYDVTSFPLPHTWLSRDWVSGRGGRGTSGIHLENRDFGAKDPSRLTTQHVIWGLNHLMLSMTLSERYCQTIAVLKWEGDAIGVIYVGRRTEPVTGSEAERGKRDILQLAQGGARGSIGDEGDDVEVTINYIESPPIDRRIIFLLAIKAMGHAAETGLDRPVTKLTTTSLQRVTWKLVSGTVAFTGIFRPGQSRLAVVKTVAKMIEDDKFEKTIVWIKVNGRSTAAGGFFPGPEENAV